MPVVKVGGGLSGGNSGSSGNAVEYLEKENKVRKKSERSTEGFFNQDSYDINPTFVVKKLDSKRQGIKKHEAKFYNLIISPSQKELAELTDDDLKDYTKEVMVKYAENFDRGVDPNDLVWFAKLEKKRKYKGFKSKKNEKLNLPPGVKSGDYKTGDNRHIHVLVRRKTEKNKSLSPLANQRKGTTKGAAVGKVGFNRIKFSATAEQLMVDQIIKINPDFERLFDDVQAYQFLNKNDYDYEKAKELGFNADTVNIILDEKNKLKRQEDRQDVVLELREIFNQAISKKPEGAEDYRSNLLGLGVKLKPIRYKSGKISGADYKLHYKGHKIKASEIGDRALQPNLKITWEHNKINAEQIRKELVLELRETFNQVMKKNPESMSEYHSFFGDLRVKLSPIKNEEGKQIDYVLRYKDQKFKPSEIDDRAIRDNLVKIFTDKYLLTVEKNKKAEQPLTSDEKVRIAINFHQKENYAGKLRNPSFSYRDNALVNAVESKHGFKITKEELQTASREIKLNNPRKGLSL